MVSDVDGLRDCLLYVNDTVVTQPIPDVYAISVILSGWGGHRGRMMILPS